MGLKDFSLQLKAGILGLPRVLRDAGRKFMPIDAVTNRQGSIAMGTIQFV
jgi:hypothetical protein